jgi:hypothetical protein
MRRLTGWLPRTFASRRSAFEDQPQGKHYALDIPIPLDKLRAGKLKTVDVGYITG